MKFVKTTLNEIKPLIHENLEKNKVTVDSFWEQHVIESNHYAITDEQESVGYFSISLKSMESAGAFSKTRLLRVYF